MQTWLAPASKCALMRFLIASAVAPGERRVDETVGAAVREVVFGETHPQPVVAIVRQTEINRCVGARERSRLRRIGFQDHLLFDAQPRLRPENFARHRRVVRRAEVRMRAGARVAREFEHFRPQRGDDARRRLRRRDCAVRRCIHLRQIVAHRFDGFAVFETPDDFDHRFVRYAEAEQETVARTVPRASSDPTS